MATPPMGPTPTRGRCARPNVARMTRFQVDSDQVAAVSAQTRAMAGRVEADVAALLSSLLDLQGSWTGAASAAFQGCVTEWRALHQQVTQSLASLQTALDTSGRQYAEAEAQSLRMFS